MIDVIQKNGLWTVTLNRPEKANALSLDMINALGAAARQAHGDPELRAFVLTGAGDRVFCAGADLGDATDMHAFTRDPAWTEMSDAIAALPCLTIAALNGTLAGGGFAPVLPCDIRICTPNAKFFYPVLKRGFLPQPNDVSRLSRLIGPSHAKMILVGGQKIDAATALTYGLVDRVVDLAEFPDTLAGLTLDALAATPQSVAAIKMMFKLDLSSSELADCYAAAYDNDPLAIDRIMGR